MTNKFIKLGGLGLRERASNIIGRNLQPQMSKSLEFIKTEKEIFDALQNKLKLVEVEEDSAKKEMETLKTLIGCDPDEDATYYMYVGGENKVENYKRYKVDYSYGNKYVSGEVALTNFTVQNKVKTNDVNTLKEKYNNACYKYWRAEEQEHKLKHIIKNLNPKVKREHKLNEWELNEYGF